VAIKGAQSRLRLKYEFPRLQLMHVYEVRSRKDRRGVDLISDALPFGGFWCGEPNAVSNTIDYAKFYSRSHDTSRVYSFRCAGNPKAGPTKPGNTQTGLIELR
jgi:hypothetical protein